MTNTDFSDFVSRETARREPESIDWQAKKMDWLARLEALYGRIESYLGDFVSAGQINLTRTPFALTEEFIGEYEAEQLTIQIGEQRIKLQPIGTLLIASAGRVDMIGPHGTATFVLVDRQSTGPHITVSIGDQDELVRVKNPAPAIDWDWKILARRPRISYIPLTETTFKDALLEISNG